VCAAPPAGSFITALYWGGVGNDEHDPTEHDVTPNDGAQYGGGREGKQNRGIISRNKTGLKSRKIYGGDVAAAPWISTKIPYVRPCSSDVSIKPSWRRSSRSENIDGEFPPPDDRSRAGRAPPEEFGSPILIEWGDRAHGEWFSWNGSGNGAPEKVQSATSQPPAYCDTDACRAGR